MDQPDTTEKSDLDRMINAFSFYKTGAFNVASSIPEAVYWEVRAEIDRLMATGASFHEAEPALRRVAQLLSECLLGER